MTEAMFMKALVVAIFLLTVVVCYRVAKREEDRWKNRHGKW